MFLCFIILICAFIFFTIFLNPHAFTLVRGIFADAGPWQEDLLHITYEKLRINILMKPENPVKWKWVIFLEHTRNLSLHGESLLNAEAVPAPEMQVQSAYLE